MRSARRTAAATAQASVHEVEAAAISLAAEVALRWAELLDLRQQQTVLAVQLTAARAAADLIGQRVRQGQAGLPELRLQEQTVVAVAAQAPLTAGVIAPT